MPRSTKASIMKKAAPSETVTSLYKDYIHGYDVLNKPYPLIGGMTLIDYFNWGRKRFNSVLGSVDRGPNEWKSDYFSQLTRNKCLGFVAHIENQMIQPSIRAQNKNQEVDKHWANFFTDTVEYTQEKEAFDDIRFWAEITGVAEGTVNLCEQYGKFNRNGKKGDGPYTVIVPNDELFLYDPFINDVQEQEWVIWRRKMTFGRAKRYYNSYDNFKNVKPGSSANWGIDLGDELRNYDSYAKLAKDEVEVIIKWGDETMDIAINGQQMTPVDNKNPRSDGLKPLSRTFFEPIDFNFAWGKHLPDKLSKEHDEADHLWRSYIDRQELHNFPPVSTSNPDLVSEEIIIPGNVIYRGRGENDNDVQPVVQSLATGVDSGTVNLIQALQLQAADSSLNQQSMGGNAQGADTATESYQIAKNAQIWLGLYGRMLSFLIRDWTTLRCNTILWMVDTKKLDVSQITSTDKLLTSGRQGTRKFEAYEGLSGMSEQPEIGQYPLLKKSFELLDKLKASNGKEETVLIDPLIMKDLDIFVYTDGEPKPKKTDMIAKAMALEDYKIFRSDPLVNPRVALEDLILARGGDPDRLILEEEAQSPAPTGVPELEAAQGGASQQGISQGITNSPKRLMDLPGANLG